MSGKWDVVHLHGIWEIDLYRISRVAHDIGIKVVWSPHGMLTPWAMKFKWLKKKMVFSLWLKKEMSRAELLHVTAASEVEDVRRNGLDNPVVVAPLGVRAMLTDKELEEIKEASRKAAQKTVLFVSRIQKKKGLLNLVEAWKGLKKTSPDVTEGWKIKIVGPDQENHTAEVKAFAKSLGVESDIEFSAPLYGREKEIAYAESSLFVLPTFSENFGSVVIEALINRTPVITTKGAPWVDLLDYNAGWWIDIGAEPLGVALMEALAMSTGELQEKGDSGRKLVEEKYAWNAVCRIMTKGYEEIL